MPTISMYELVGCNVGSAGSGFTTFSLTVGGNQYYVPVPAAKVLSCSQAIRLVEELHHTHPYPTQQQVTDELMRFVRERPAEDPWAWTLKEDPIYRVLREQQEKNPVGISAESHPNLHAMASGKKDAEGLSGAKKRTDDNLRRIFG